MHSFLFTALPSWQLAPTAWGDLSVPADTGSADDPTSYASPFNANASELCSDADNLLGLLHFPAEPAVIAPLEPTAAAITAKLQNWAPSNTDLFLDGSKLGAELANEAATLIQQAFRVWSGGSVISDRSELDLGRCDCCDHNVSEYGDSMMNCAGRACFTLCHYECLGCSAVTAWEKFSNDGGQGAQTWLCQQCVRTGNAASDCSEEDDKSVAGEVDKTDQEDANPGIIPNGWADLDIEQQVAFQAQLPELLARRRKVAVMALKLVMEEMLAAEAKGDLAQARLKLDRARELEATAEKPFTSDDMRRESWLLLARMGK